MSIIYIKPTYISSGINLVQYDISIGYVLIESQFAWMEVEIRPYYSPAVVLSVVQLLISRIHEHALY